MLLLSSRIEHLIKKRQHRSEKDSDNLKAIPQTFALHHNYPNPFNPTTSINFDLPNNTNVTIAGGMTSMEDLRQIYSTGSRALDTIPFHGIPGTS